MVTGKYPARTQTLLSRNLANEETQKEDVGEWMDGTWGPSLVHLFYPVHCGAGTSGQNLVVLAVLRPDSKDSPAVSCHPRPVAVSSGSTGLEA